jgi:hypothetical protein
MRGVCFLAVSVLVVAPAAAQASSRAVNFQTKTATVVCGIAAGIPGTEFDPGTEAQLDGDYLGLQCDAMGLPTSKHGDGDPVVQLGQGHDGRAKLVYSSGDNYVSDAKFVTLAPGSTWRRDNIACKLSASSVRCTNDAGHGFTLATGHLRTF